MMERVNFLWRLAMTGVCFTVFGLGGVLVSITICPLQLLIYPQEELRKQKARKLVHYLFKFFVGLLRYTGVARFQIENEQALKSLSGNIIMANHPSLIDVVVLISIVPNADCVVKGDLFKNPFMKGILKSTGYISNLSADAVIDDCDKSLKAGNNLIIFPEGTRTTPGKQIKFQRGAANIALRCKAPILSVLIKVTPTTLTKAEKWYHIPDKRFLFSLKVSDKHPTIQASDDTVLSKKSRQFTSALEQHFMKELREYE
ncbi:lysophospholipid acyltransferase family protein [Thalassotalea ganghwensis]